VIKGATCNGTDTSGCSHAPATVTVGNSPSILAVDQATDTIYVGSFDDNTVSVINGATCNGTDNSGCGQSPPTVAVGAFPDGLAVDEATNTIYVANGGDNTVSVIDGSSCNGANSSRRRCGRQPS
jgi:YVTN family beta-propeller protein